MAKVYVGLDMGSSGFHQVAMDKDKVVLKDREFETSEANLITRQSPFSPRSRLIRERADERSRRSVEG